MKKYLSLILCAFFLLTVFPEASAASLEVASVKSETSVLSQQGKKKKRYKGYKKPKRKKFLGIFKRKSSCDCPNH
jgi:hypothetical protein